MDARWDGTESEHGSGRHFVARDLHAGRRSEFASRGHKERHFFPHRVVRLPKPGPDGYRLALRMCGVTDVSQLWELVIYALPPVLDEFPPGLFFDNDVVWHQQQFGLPGQVATVDLVETSSEFFAMVMLSDVVQRIGRRPEVRTRVDSRFQGWPRLLLHAICDFASDRGVRHVHVPTADWALQHTDPSRPVPQRTLFDRIYDSSVGPPFRAERRGRWWVLDVQENAHALARPEVRQLPLFDGPELCVCHDIERGWGHHDVEPSFGAWADETAPAFLEAMLEAERRAGARATYSVVGNFLDEIRTQVEEDGHCIAFHSYDHGLHPTRPAGYIGRLTERAARRLRSATRGQPGVVRQGQLERCRSVDYRIKGYRPPQSRMTPELTVENLAFHNFEWLASSTRSLRADKPRLEKGLVRIPILLDDFDLHRGTPYEDWEQDALQRMDARSWSAFSLHDCYADRWLDHYPRLLERLGSLGRLRTLDEVASDTILSGSI